MSLPLATKPSREPLQRGDQVLMWRGGRLPRDVVREFLVSHRRPWIDAVIHGASHEAGNPSAGSVARLQPTAGNVLAPITSVVFSGRQVLLCPVERSLELTVGVESAHGDVPTLSSIGVVLVLAHNPSANGVIIGVDRGHATDGRAENQRLRRAISEGRTTTSLRQTRTSSDTPYIL